MSDDLISRQAAIDALSMMQGIVAENGVRKGISLAWQQIKDLPSAQPERKKGKWTREVLGSTSGYGTTTMYQCSVCECMEIEQYDYCPNCGADMRGGEK